MSDFCPKCRNDYTEPACSAEHARVHARYLLQLADEWDKEDGAAASQRPLEGIREEVAIALRNYDGGAITSGTLIENLRTVLRESPQHE